ncbi:MAG: hypothetical protein AAFO69_05190, partial [Bacteroidota bacterium]
EQGISYLFKYPDEETWRGVTTDRHSYEVTRHTVPEASMGRKMFDYAETLCTKLEKLREPLFKFLIAERKKIIPEEVIEPVIVNITIRWNASTKEIETVVALNDDNPENAPLYQYWRVLLKNFEPYRLL